MSEHNPGTKIDPELITEKDGKVTSQYSKQAIQLEYPSNSSVVLYQKEQEGIPVFEVVGKVNHVVDSSRTVHTVHVTGHSRLDVSSQGLGRVVVTGSVKDVFADDSNHLRKASQRNTQITQVIVRGKVLGRAESSFGGKIIIFGKIIDEKRDGEKKVIFGMRSDIKMRSPVQVLL